MNNIIFSDVETPCFVIDTDFFKKSLESFQSAMSKYFKNFIFYSSQTACTIIVLFVEPVLKEI